MSFRELIGFNILLLTLSLGFNKSLMAAPQLDLSIPKEILTSEDQSFSGQKSSEDFNHTKVDLSPEHAFYIQNANEKILRRLKAVPAQDQFGKQICGKIQYRAIVRPDGSLKTVEVVPVKQTENYESKVEVYANPTPSFQNATGVSRLETFASDEDEINIFVDAMTQAIYGAAPFPPYSKHTKNSSQESDMQKTETKFAMIYGTFWRECHGWTQPKNMKLQ